MRTRIALAAAGAAILLGVAGYLAYQAALVPLALTEGRDLYVKGSPEFGEDAARLEVLLPAGRALEDFLAAQSGLPLIEQAPSGAWAGQLATGLQGSRHGRRWRITVRPGWRMHDGATLDATQVGQALGPKVAKLGGEARVVDPATLDLRFPVRPVDLPSQLSRWRVPGTGPFLRQGTTLTRFEAFSYGKAGIAGLTVVTDPACMESRAWAEGLTSARWAWAVFPGTIAPEDMAKVRLAPYDEFHLKGGAVWFLSRRMRRLRPDASDWTRTRLFGVWKGAMDLPFDPLGL